MNPFRILIAAMAITFFWATASAQSIDNPYAQVLAAVRAGNLATVKELVEKQGANINSRNRIGETLVMMAIKNGKGDIANYLLDQGADPKIASTAQSTTLIAAAFNGDLPMVNRLLDKGVDLHAADQQKKTAMVYAAAAGHAEVVQRLLKAGVDVNARYLNDLTALMWAAGQGHARAVQALLDAGADRALKDNRGKTAADIGHTEIMTLLGGACFPETQKQKPAVRQAFFMGGRESALFQLDFELRKIRGDIIDVRVRHGLGDDIHHLVVALAVAELAQLVGEINLGLAGQRGRAGHGGQAAIAMAHHATLRDFRAGRDLVGGQSRRGEAGAEQAGSEQGYGFHR